MRPHADDDHQDDDDGDHDDDRGPSEPFDTSTGEPPVFGEARHSVLSPSGQVESAGDFVRGLGPRRARIALFAVGAVLLLMALLAALAG